MTVTSGAPARTVLLPGALGLWVLSGGLYTSTDEVAVGWLLLVAVAIGVVPLVALLRRPYVEGLTVARLLPPRAPVGAEVPSTLLVSNRGDRTSGDVLVRDVAPGFGDVVVLVPPLPPGGRTEVTVQRTATARGAHPAGIMRVEAVGPFGLTRRVRDVELEGVVHVHPAPAPAPALPVSSRYELAGCPSGRAGRGTELLQLRDWRPGDGARAVSARASARHGRPVVVERERDGGCAVSVLVAGPPGGQTWERSLAVACGAALRAVEEGLPAALLAAAHPAPLRPGRRDVLDWFAGADAAEQLDDRTVAQALRTARQGVLLAVVASDDVATRLTLRRAAAAAGVPLWVLDG